MPLATGAAWLIDTPGLRSVGLVGDPGAVAATFADIVELAAHCRFRDCHHHGEPGCAVVQAVAEGILEPRRLESWRRQRREADRAAQRGRRVPADTRRAGQ